MLKPPPLKVNAPVQLPLAANTLSQAQQAPAAEHIVQQGESASQIIQKWLTEDMSMQQMLVALLKNQPDAFIQGNVNLLRAGAVLKAPSQTAVRAIDSEDTQTVKGQSPSRQMSGKVGQDQAQQTPAQAKVDQLKLSQASIEKQNAESRLAAQRALSDAQKQLDLLQSNVNQLVQLNATAPISVGQAPATTPANSTESGSGLLNLNKLLEAPQKNSYLWAALTLLGVLAVWAGLRIQSRKSSNTLSTLMPQADMVKSTVNAPSDIRLAMPADIASLNLDLDSNAPSPKSPGSVRSTASTETLQ
jgi:pilus assembly protein FimV